MKKKDIKIGMSVKYRIPYFFKQHKTEYVQAEVRNYDPNFPYPTVELNNGHEAQWDGEKFVMCDIGGDVVLEKS